MAYDDTDTDEANEREEPGEEASPSDAEAAKIHTEALEEFDEIIQAVQEERAEALQDRRFVSIAGAQWEGKWGEQFENSIMVEVNKTAMGVEKIISDYRRNRITVNFRAVGDNTHEDTAETLNGLYRADLYNSKGQQAIDNAFEEAVQGGYGAYRFVNVWEDELDPENDRQRIAVKAIVDADQSVFWDMNAKLYDKSDAMRCFVITQMTTAAFAREYGADKATDWPVGIVKPHYDWFTPDTVAIAEYYRVEEVTAKLAIYKHKLTDEERREWVADLDADARKEMKTEGWELQRTRKAKKRQVCKWTFSGCDELEPKQIIAGDCIPVVPVYGKRWFIDNMERARGHVRLAKDPQRIYNAQISKLVETTALTPAEVPIFTPEQVAGHENLWAQGNLDRKPYRLVNPITDENGQQQAQGPLGSLSPPQLPPVLAALIQIASNDIEGLTGSDDNSDTVQANVSADAMDIAATRTDAKSEIYMDNGKQSIQRGGEIYKSMSRDVYFEPGRKVETMDDQNQPSTATLAEPHVDAQGNYAIRNDLTKGKYLVICDVQEATATRRDKTVKTLVSMASISAQADPQLAAACLSTALINMDGEGIDDLQAWQRQLLIQNGVVKPNDAEKKELAAQQQQQQANQQPDPTAQALQAQGEAFKAAAAKDVALATKAGADTELSKAKAIQTLALAHKTNADAGLAHAATLNAHADVGHTHAQTHATHVETLDKLTAEPEAHPMPAPKAAPIKPQAVSFAPQPAAPPPKPNLMQRLKGAFGR